MTPDSHSIIMKQGHTSYDKTTKEEYQIRNRTILRRPNSYSTDQDEACSIHISESYNSEMKYEPSSAKESYLFENRQHESLIPLRERRSCSESEECKASYHYKWSLTGWSSCLPKNINADSTCGEGFRR